MVSSEMIKMTSFVYVGVDSFCRGVIQIDGVAHTILPHRDSDSTMVSQCSFLYIC